MRTRYTWTGSIGRLESEAYRLFVELYQKKKKLFDIYPDRPERIVKCQEEWGGPEDDGQGQGVL